MNQDCLCKMIYAETEVRKLKSISPSHALRLAQILEENDSWKLLMSVVPKVLDGDKIVDCTDKKYTADHIKLLENATRKDPRPASEIFLFEWGCSGRRRPTMYHLLMLLKAANLYRAADYVAIDILNQAAVERPTSGPAAKINIALLDDELHQRDPIDANENPQFSNITIDNNLDNSKVRNDLRRADAPKLIMQTERRVAENSTAIVKTNNVQQPIASSEENNQIEKLLLSNNNCLGKSKRECDVGDIVLQSPPQSNNVSNLIIFSDSNNQSESDLELIQSTLIHSDVERPNLSALLSSQSNDNAGGERPDLSNLLVVETSVGSNSSIDHSMQDYSFVESSEISAISSNSVNESANLILPPNILDLNQISLENVVPAFSALLNEATVGKNYDSVSTNSILQDDGTSSSESD